MTEKELIIKLRELRQIRPRQDWVILTKNQILGEEPKKSLLGSFLPRVFFQLKLVYSSLIIIFILFGIFVFAQNSLPGDLLYPIKKITEKSQAVFVSEKEKPKIQLELTNKRLEELVIIAEENQIKKLAPALKEYQASLSQATKKIAQIKEPKEVRKIIPEIKKLEGNLENLKVYGIEVGEEEAENLQKLIVENLIKDLEGRTLTEEQEDILVQAKSDFEAGNYSAALEKILILSQNK